MWNFSSISVANSYTSLDHFCTIVSIFAMNNFSGRFFIASFVILCICFVTNSESPAACTDLFLPDHDDCTKYYICFGSKAIRMSCRSGSHWNKKLNVCDEEQSSQCERTDRIRPSNPAKLNEFTPKCGPQKKTICYGRCPLASYFSNYRI